MMKKLAVTLFALSLTALGCGSDSGTKTDAAPKLDTPPGVEVALTPDVPVTPGPEAGPEAQLDNASAPIDVAIDQVKPTDVAIDQATPIDVATPIDGAVDARIDGGAVDVQPSEAGHAIDGGVDSGSVG
jgi:hypothetical protein